MSSDQITLFQIILDLAPLAFGLLAACLVAYTFLTPRSRA